MFIAHCMLTEWYRDTHCGVTLVEDLLCPGYMSVVILRTLAPLGHIWDVILAWRKGILTELSLCYSIVYYYNGAHWYEQVKQVGRLNRALILLGLALYLPSTSVSSPKWPIQCVEWDCKPYYTTTLYLRSSWSCMCIYKKCYILHFTIVPRAGDRKRAILLAGSLACVVPGPV